jgi:hypothetical protein
MKTYIIYLPGENQLVSAETLIINMETKQTLLVNDVDNANGGGMKRADLRAGNYQTITNNERSYTL